MLKIKNKFIIFIILIIIWIVISIFISSYLDKNNSFDSHVVLVSWDAELNKTPLILKQKSKLNIWDKVKTIWNDSLAVLEWWDGSVTRLGWNTSVEISELHISNDLSKINIKFSLLSGKSWTNLVSFFWEWSYFKEYFRDSEAAVRWTVFNVDLDNDYLYVTDHKVDLTTSSWELIEVNEKQPLDLKTFSFMDLHEFIQKFKDKTFEQINIQLDNDLLVILRKRLASDLVNIKKLNEIDLNDALWDELKKTELYNKMLSDYQKLNFIKPDDAELFKVKLELKDKLLQLSTPENKTKLINSTLNDFKEMIDSKKYENVDQLLQMLSTNKESLINFDLNDYLKDRVVPEEIKSKITSKFADLKDFFQSSFDNIKNTNLGIEDIKIIEEKADTKVKEILDWISNKLINK